MHWFWALYIKVAFLLQGVRALAPASLLQNGWAPKVLFFLSTDLYVFLGALEQPMGKRTNLTCLFSQQMLYCCLWDAFPVRNQCVILVPHRRSSQARPRNGWCDAFPRTPVPKWKNAPADCGFSRWFIACFFIRKWLVNSPGQWVMKRFAAGRPIPVTTATVAVVPWKVCSKCAPSICCRC